MWEEFYEFLKHLDHLIEKHPNETYFTVEVEQHIYDLWVEIGFISKEGFIDFKGKTFILG